MNQDNIYAALARAQATFKVAQKTGYNPHFKSSFSTYEDLVAASRESLTREGLSVCQYLHYDTEKDIMYFVTLLNHASNEHVASNAPLFLKDRSDIQKLGSAISYIQRYMYRTICGIVTTDDEDDGNSLSSAQQELVSDKQLAFIKKLLNGNAEREAKICARYGIDKLDKLLLRDASEVIKVLSVPTKE